MANTTLNTSDKSAAITLTGSNLIATSSSSSVVAVRAVDRQTTGKFYWECTCNTSTVSGGGAGLMISTATLSGGVATGASSNGTTGLSRTGFVWVDGVQGIGSLGTVTSGSLVCVAVDLTARLIWFRLGAAGNWNNNAANNPAVGMGGVAIPNLGGAIGAYPAVALAANGDQTTANFGDSAFTGTVPATFTPGWPAGAGAVNYALATQVAAEHWLTTNPDGRVTQIALEHWATVTGTGLQAVVTQVALEHWASVVNVPVSVGAPMITMIG